MTVRGSPLLLLLGSDFVPSSVDEEKGKRWVEAVALCLALTSPVDSLKRFSPEQRSLLPMEVLNMVSLEDTET